MINVTQNLKFVLESIVEKGENAGLLFPQCFQSLLLEGSKNQELLGKGVNPTSNNPDEEGFVKHCGKKRKCW